MNHEEKHLEYEVKRVTEYGQYTAIIQVDREERKTHIALYNGDPVISTLWGLFTITQEPIKEAKYGLLADVNQTITRMIVDWELPFYQRDKAETSDSYLVINHEEELKKRKARLQQLSQDEEEMQKSSEIIYKDWQDDNVYVLDRSAKRGIHPNSLANLKQYQNKKKID